MIQRAQHRIFISSLYIGSTESELVGENDFLCCSLTKLMDSYQVLIKPFESNLT